MSNPYIEDETRRNDCPISAGEDSVDSGFIRRRRRGRRPNVNTARSSGGRTRRASHRESSYETLQQSETIQEETHPPNIFSSSSVQMIEEPPFSSTGHNNELYQSIPAFSLDEEYVTEDDHAQMITRERQQQEEQPGLNPEEMISAASSYVVINLTTGASRFNVADIYHIILNAIDESMMEYTEEENPNENTMTAEEERLQIQQAINISLNTSQPVSSFRGTEQEMNEKRQILKKTIADLGDSPSVTSDLLRELESRYVCSICRENQKMMCFDNCKHLCVCEQCYIQLVGYVESERPESMMPKCPICNVSSLAHKIYM